MALPVLWHFPISHYNEKARWALDWKRIPHRRQALLWSYLPRALWATGQPRLPILFLDGRAIADSTRIIEALEQRYPDPPLYPRDEAARRRALALEDFFDEELGPPLRAAVLGEMMVRSRKSTIAAFAMEVPRVSRWALHVFYPVFRAIGQRRNGISRDTAAAGRAKISTALDRIEAELLPSGYLVGDGFSVADLTAAALFSRLVFPPEFPYDPPVALPDWLVEYQHSLEHRAAYQWVLEMYRRHRGTSAEVGARVVATDGGRHGEEARSVLLRVQ